MIRKIVVMCLIEDHIEFRLMSTSTANNANFEHVKEKNGRQISEMIKLHVFFDHHHRQPVYSQCKILNFIKTRHHIF